jgi:translation initiation factor 5B
VPTSAVTGEGICDLLWLFVRITQTMMMDRLMFVEELQCTVLEVKVVEGYGHTIDAVLINGRLREGDKARCHYHLLFVSMMRSLLIWAWCAMF